MMSSHGRTDARRKLIWVPVIHTQADLGSMSESVRQFYIAKMGRANWMQRSKSIDSLWFRIRQNIDLLALDYSKVRLYQDGLPCSGLETAIVNELAKAGSINHRILLDLMKKGATLTGTESVELLLEEYEVARKVLVSLGSGHEKTLNQNQKECDRLLLNKRDVFIADRIGATLQPGETGLIFLGMLHSLEGRLAPDIGLTRLGSFLESKPVSA